MDDSRPIAPLDAHHVNAIVRRALDEDLHQAGDITTASTIPYHAQAIGRIRARVPGRIAGLDLARATFHALDPTLECTASVSDGERVTAGQTVMRLTGRAQPILTGERVALNFLGHLSGVATATAALVAGTEGLKAQVCCTRKTLPGLRQIQKYAVRAGGGMNHRFGLFDAVMIKDNHIVAGGGLETAIKRAKAYVGHTVKIEVEVDNLDQLVRALPLGPDIVLLDNMSPDLLETAVSLCKGQCLTEASGNITIATVTEIAQSGVDYISSGWITHSARNLDLGMDFSLPS